MAGITFCNVLLGLSVTALAGPVCPPDGNKYEANKIDFDEWEIWPLSGGVASGVEVTLEATKIEGVATIHFVTAQYEVLASYTLDTGDKKVWRTTCKADVSDQSDYGGWPFEDGDSAVHLTFHNSRSVLEDAAKNDAWAISYQHIRMPWFDLEAASDAMAVYAMVSKGFVDGEIVDRRSECSTTCHKQECTDKDNNEVTCEGGCKSRTPSTLDGLTVSTCSASAPSGNGVFCCEGRQLKHIAKADAENGKYDGTYVRVHDNADAVRIACLSFLAGAESAEECKDTASLKVRVDAYDGDDATVSVLVPKLFAKGKDHRVKIPVEVLDVSPIQWQTITRTRPRDSAWGIKVELGHPFAGLISEVTDENEVDFAGKEWWYVNMVNIGCNNLNHNAMAHCKDAPTAAWWVSFNEYTENDDYTIKLREYGYDYFVTDEPRDHTTCTDEPDWKDGGDSDGLEATCENYQEYDFCTDYGVATANFTARAYAHDDTIKFKRLLNARPLNGWSAAFTCCTCGGGNHDPPPANVPSLRSVMME